MASSAVVYQSQLVLGLPTSTGATTPYHFLSFKGTGDTYNETNGNYLQLKFSVTATRRLDIKRVYVKYRPKAVDKHRT